METTPSVWPKNTLNEFLDYNTCAETLAGSGSRALGALTAKFFSAKGLHYKSFTKLYNSTVLPVIHYGTAIWGYKKYHRQELIHQRAMRVFLGVGKKTPIPGLYGEMGWQPLSYFRHRDMVRYWLKLFNMSGNRLTKQVFNWDYRRCLLGKKGWNREVKEVLQASEQTDVFYGLDVEQQKKVLSKLEKSLETKENNKLLKEINSMQKLRTYKELKLTPGTEDYVASNMEKYSRSLIAKIRIGTLPIMIETGRYKQQPADERRCLSCPDKVEDEKHFLMDCPLYNNIREAMVE